MPRDRRTHRYHARPLSWFLLVVLAWAQLAYAAHQFEHSHHLEAGESCAVCLQFERNDDALVDSVTASLHPAITFLSADESPLAIRVERFRHYASRASP